MQFVASITGLTAVLIGITTWTPQLARIFKLRSSHGFSTLTLVISSASVATWLAYSFQVNDLEQMLVNFVMIVINLLIAYFLDLKTLLYVVLSKVAFFITLFFINDSGISGMVGTILICSIFIPQFIKIVRSSDVLGVSRVMYGFQITQSLLWFIHAVSGAYYALIFPNVFLIFLSVIILLTLHSKKRNSISKDVIIASSEIEKVEEIPESIQTA